MKLIVVPTDFTITSSNAVFYAAEMANLYESRLIVFHVVNRPNFTPTYGEDQEKVEEVEFESTAMLKTIFNKIIERYGEDFPVETRLLWGSPNREINDLIRDEKPDLMVLGVRETNFLTANWDVSSAKDLYGNVRCPVLAVKQHNSFQRIEKVAIVNEAKSSLSSDMIQLVEKLEGRFHPLFHFVNTSNLTDDHTTIKSQLKQINAEMNYELHDKPGMTMGEDLLDFTKVLGVDLIIFMARKKSFSIWDLFRWKSSEEVIVQGNVPILTLSYT